MTDELKMLADLPIEIPNVGHFHVPRLKDIASLGEERYSQILSLLLLNKANIPHLKDIEFDNFSILFVNCLNSDELWSEVKIGLELLFKEEVHIPSRDDESVFFYFGDILNKRYVTRDNFDYIQSLIIFSNNIKIETEDEYKPANSKAAELIKRLHAGKEYVNKKKKQIVSLANKISGLAWKSNNVNIFDVWNLNIYQFYDAINRLEQIDNYQFTLQGIYSGTVNGSKMKLSELHYSNSNKI
ncbi:hypothetical protein [Paenibacillus sp. NAIST15-1]|uniref:hypothetical protein n=1 Tax=Paenibacillus sp. NAIST15-1 TaxID=1605994 RepID=UPI00086DDF1C|nr:hypothetical protein [Paenibacillus sp. NAIST15-1]GAV11288.1 hypothetical protein PBN151_1215 [Paenibacillus sp. NAIST15-1]